MPHEATAARCGVTQMRYEITFYVPWVRGWQRAGVNFRSGGHYTRNRTSADEQEIAFRYKRACRDQYGMQVMAPPHVPVTLIIDAYSKGPARRPRYLPTWLWPRMPFTVKPDADNIAKLMDGLNGVAWHDDAQVTKLLVIKHDRNYLGNEETAFTILWEEPDEEKQDCRDR